MKSLELKIFRIRKVSHLSLYLCKALPNHCILLPKGAKPRLVYPVIEVYHRLCSHEALLKHHILMTEGGEPNLFCD